MNTVNHDSYFRLALSENHHNMLHKHLFPGVGLEAAAILLCSQSSASRYLVKDILLVDYSECRTRTNDFISWPRTYIENAIDAAETNNLSIVLVHSHPGGTLVFSDMDDDSDREFLPALFEANESLDTLHGSAIMTPDGAIRARFYNRRLDIIPVNAVHCAGDNIIQWKMTEFDSLQPHPMAFSAQMGKDLKSFTACIVGVSGTGSIIVE